MDLKRLVVESKNGSDSITKDLFVALLGSEDLVLDGEFDSEVKLLKNQKDLEEVVSTLKREKEGIWEKLTTKGKMVSGVVMKLMLG